MHPLLNERIARAKELLAGAWHIALASVNEDGSPHNSPVFFAYDKNLEHIYWASSPESRHSKNAMRTGQLFAVLYEATIGGGLYLRLDDICELSGNELDEGLVHFNEARQRAKKSGPIDRAMYAADGPQRLYRASVRQLWVNLADYNPRGEVLHDGRHEITTADLL